MMNNIDDGTGKKETRIKLIRNESIGAFSWSSTANTVNKGYGVNDWLKSRLMKLLNPGYESDPIGGSLYWNRQNGTCYNGMNLTSTACNFSNTGVTESMKSFIANAMWNLGSNGSILYNTVKTNQIYLMERKNNTGKICTSGVECNDTVNRAVTWAGKIGLMYPSDYGYATSGGNSVNRTNCLDTILYNWRNTVVTDCKENNWLYKPGVTQWLLTPEANVADASHVFIAFEDGIVGRSLTYFPCEIRPAVYLKSNIKITSGNGSINNAFKLSL